MIGLLLGAALSATPITLAEAREQARQNPQALQAALDYVRAHENTRAQRAGLLPQLSVGAARGGDWISESRSFYLAPVLGANGAITAVQSSTVDVPNYYMNIFQFTGTLNQVLFDWGKFEALAQAGAQEAAAKAQVEEQVQFAEYEAIRRFYVLLAAQRSGQVLDATAERSAQQVERANALFEAARGGKGDVLAAEINLNNDRIAALRQRESVAAAGVDLAAWLGRSETEELSAVDPGTLETAPASRPPLDDLISQAHHRRPLLRVVDEQLSAAERGVSSAVGGYLPRANAQLLYRRNGVGLDPVFTTPELNNDFTALVTLQWDLFSGFGTYAAVKGAQAQASKAQIVAEQTRRDVEGQLRIAAVNVDEMVRIAELARSTEETAGQNLSYAQKRFQAGAASTLEVRDAELKLTQAQLSFLQSRVDVEVARAALARLSGTLDF